VIRLSAAIGGGLLGENETSAELILPGHRLWTKRGLRERLSTKAAHLHNAGDKKASGALLHTHPRMTNRVW
jgi:hypothetical protein